MGALRHTRHITTHHTMLHMATPPIPENPTLLEGMNSAGVHHQGLLCAGIEWARDATRASELGGAHNVGYLESKIRLPTTVSPTPTRTAMVANRRDDLRCFMCCLVILPSI